MRMQTNEARKNGSYSNDIWQWQLQTANNNKNYGKEDYLCV